MFAGLLVGCSPHEEHDGTHNDSDDKKWRCWQGVFTADHQPGQHTAGKHEDTPAQDNRNCFQAAAWPAGDLDGGPRVWQTVTLQWIANRLIVRVTCHGDTLLLMEGVVE